MWHGGFLFCENQPRAPLVASEGGLWSVGLEALLLVCMLRSHNLICYYCWVPPLTCEWYSALLSLYMSSSSGSDQWSL